MNKQWPNDSIPLCFKPKNYKNATNGFRTANHTNDWPRDCLRATPLYCHTHKNKGRGMDMLVSKTLILLCENRLEKGRTKQFCLLLFNALMVEPLEEVREWVSLLFLLGLFCWNYRRRMDSSQENSTLVLQMNCRILVFNPSRKFSFIFGQD